MWLPWGKTGEGISREVEIDIYTLLCIKWASLVSLAGKESACTAGDPGSIPRLGRSPGEGIGSTPVFWSGEFCNITTTLYSITPILWVKKQEALKSLIACLMFHS